MGLWDYIMTGGWTAIYRIALTILLYKESELVNMDLDEVGKTMREWKGTQIIGIFNSIHIFFSSFLIYFSSSSAPHPKVVA